MMDSVHSGSEKKAENKHTAHFSDLSGMCICAAFAVCVVPYILLIPLLADCLLKRLLKQGALQQTLCLHAQVFEKLILAIPGQCQLLSQLHSLT